MHKSYFYGSPDSYIQVVAHKQGCHDTLTRLGFVDSADKLGGEVIEGERAPRPNTEYTGQAAQEISREDLVDLVNGSQTKDQLEALVKDAFGVDLDKRKGLGKLKAEALELVNES